MSCSTSNNNVKDESFYQFSDEAERHEPTSRYFHSTAVVGERLFLWAGNQEETPRTHDSADKRTFLSCVEVFHLQRGSWEQQTTSGIPPLGVAGYACVAVDSDLHYFGGWCGHGDCRHNSVHKLSTSSLQWRVLAPTTTGGKAPMKKAHSGMVAFKDGGEDFLFVIGGRAAISSWQPGVQYEHNDINEQHTFSLSTSE